MITGNIAVGILNSLQRSLDLGIGFTSSTIYQDRELTETKLWSDKRTLVYGDPEDVIDLNNVRTSFSSSSDFSHTNIIIITNKSIDNTPIYVHVSGDLVLDDITNTLSVDGLVSFDFGINSTTTTPLDGTAQIDTYLKIAPNSTLVFSGEKTLESLQLATLTEESVVDYEIIILAV